MKRGPIGVWFSAALVIFGLSVWGGVVAGKQLAFYWWRHKDRALQKSYTPERAHLELELRQLGSIGTSHAFQIIAQYNPKIWKDSVLKKIDSLEKEVGQQGYEDIKPILELDLGLAYVDAVFIDENENNSDLAARHLKSAQMIFQSLGWKDYSEETLKKAAQHDFNKWKMNPNVATALK